SIAALPPPKNCTCEFPRIQLKSTHRPARADPATYSNMGTMPPMAVRMHQPKSAEPDRDSRVLTRYVKHSPAGFTRDGLAASRATPVLRYPQGYEPTPSVE